MALSYLLRFLSFGRYGTDNPGRSTVDTASSLAAPQSLTSSSIEQVLPTQPDAQPPLASITITSSHIEHIQPSQSDSENPNDIVKTCNQFAELNLAISPPSTISLVTNESTEDTLPRESDFDNTVKAADESPESNLAGFPPAPWPSIIVSSFEHIPLSQPDSEILNNIVETLNESPQSDLAELPSAMTNSSAEHVLSNQSNPGTTDDLVDSHDRHPESNLNISQVSLLIRSAQIPGNESALNQIRAFIRNALRTPPKRQTSEQRYALAHLDNASVQSRKSSNFSISSMIILPSQLSLSSSSFSSSLKIFVDASESGIGFVHNDRWLAWTFTPNPNIPRGSNQKIIMSWAELIAVELGILTLLSGGYRDIPVLVMSDNRGVVRALTRKKWKAKYNLDITLNRILCSCEEGSLELKAQWLWGKKNIADGPSRGQYPPPDLMLNHAPRIPQHLEKLVNQIAGPSLAEFNAQ